MFSAMVRRGARGLQQKALKEGPRDRNGIEDGASANRHSKGRGKQRVARITSRPLWCQSSLDPQHEIHFVRGMRGGRPLVPGWALAERKGRRKASE